MHQLPEKNRMMIRQSYVKISLNKLLPDYWGMHHANNVIWLNYRYAYCDPKTPNIVICHPSLYTYTESTTKYLII